MAEKAGRGPDYDGTLSEKFKVSSRGTWETNEAINRMAGIASYGAARDTYGRIPGKAPVVNAVLLYVDRLPRDVQALILEEGMKILRAILDGGQEPPIRIPSFDRPSPGAAPLDASTGRSGGPKDAKPRRRPG